MTWVIIAGQREMGISPTQRVEAGPEWTGIGWLVCNIAHRIKVTTRSKRIREGGPRDRGEGPASTGPRRSGLMFTVERKTKQNNFTACSVLSFPNNQIDPLLSLYERKSFETPSFRRS